jgi:argininosuccinate synthase
MSRIVLGYSGAVEGSMAIPWLAERHGAEIVAVTLDVGQRGELVAVREQALALGALRSHVIDVRDEFVRDYVLPTLQAVTLAPDDGLVVGHVARPLIVRKLVDVAAMENATAIAHGVRDAAEAEIVEREIRALNPSITVLAPVRTWNMSAAEEDEYARARNIPQPQANRAQRVSTNLWGRSIGPATSVDLWNDVPPGFFTMTRAPQDCPDQPAFVEIEFQAGVPVRANGIEMPLLEMIDSLEIIGGTHGVGRIETVTGDTTPRRIVQEAPAAVVLQIAHAALQRLVTSDDLATLSGTLGRRYVELIESGRWFTPTREALDAFVSSVQQRVTGAVRLKLFKGDCRPVGRRSPFAGAGDGASDAQRADERLIEER